MPTEDTLKIKMYKLNSKLEGLLTKFGDKRVELKKDVVSRYNKTMGLFQKNLKAITDKINVLNQLI